MSLRPLLAAASALLSILAAGCSPPTNSSEQDAARLKIEQSFAALQAALKAEDPERLWDLLDERTQEMANKVAHQMRTGHGRADADKKANLRDKYGLTDDELAQATGKVVLKSKTFREANTPLITATLLKVGLVGTNGAVVTYKNADGAEHVINFNRENGNWKAEPDVP
jgi:hypothetical protein